MHHQYHLEICTSPIPALRVIKNFQAPEIEFINRLTTPAQTIIRTTQSLETHADIVRVVCFRLDKLFVKIVNQVGRSSVQMGVDSRHKSGQKTGHYDF